MPVKNFSSIGGYAVDATQVMDTDRALKNISAMHMVSNHFVDANKDIFILKRQTDAANNTMDMSLDGGTPLVSNTPPLVNDSVAFATGTVYGQETTNNTYVYAAKLDIIVTTNNSGVPTVNSTQKNILRNNPTRSRDMECCAKCDTNWCSTIFYFPSIECDNLIYCEVGRCFRFNSRNITV